MQLSAYEGLHDLQAMLNVLSVGRKAEIATYYVHPGDLQWWLFYTYVPEEVWQSNIHLWKENGQLLGWVFLSMDMDAFDVYVLPELCGTPCEYELLTWAVEQMSAHSKVETIWIAEDDQQRIHWLEQNGFVEQTEHTILMKRFLSGPLDGPALPDGFSLRFSRGPQDARLRSVASHASFKAKKPFEEYLPRTLNFMQSPVYVPEHEIFVTAADGQVASFCVIWTDTLTQSGLFEPVGTHPAFQGKSLGKSLLFEGLRRLKLEGMNEASVCVNSDNPAAIRLYESVGFQKVKRLLTFVKK
ncbi:MAG: GNAT family N-acetyltransferase [Anaerolineales bacterium]